MPLSVSKLIFIVFVMLCCVGIVMGALAVRAHYAAATYTCVAGPGEICFSDLFAAEYKRWQGLRDKKTHMEQDAAKSGDFTLELEAVQDQYTGMTTRLSQQLPSKKLGYDADYQVDDKKLRFVKVVPLPALTDAPPPAAAAPAKK
jgi:hypothetical protein